MTHSRRVAWLSLLPLWLATLMTQAGDFKPPLPAAFLPGGMFGIQLGASWDSAKKSPLIKRLSCAPKSNHGAVFDEVCFFQSSSRLAGASIRDGFIVRKGNQLVLIGATIGIKNVDDPRAETLMRGLQTQVHAKFQQSGNEVVFADMPDQGLSKGTLAGLAQQLPVLLVELESEQTVLGVLYGYLGPVNAFTAVVGE
jgi:hypothetical protein